MLEGDASQEDLSLLAKLCYLYLEPVPPDIPAGSQEMLPIVIRDLLAPPDGLTGDQHHPVPLPVLDRVGVTRVVEEGEAAINGVANRLHGE